MQRAPYLFPSGARLGEDNLVLHASAARHRVDQFAGPLSIKTVARGHVSWVVGRRELVVDRTSFLVLAAGEQYSMNIDAVTPVETCCAFFAPGFVEEIARDLTTGSEQALEDPDRLSPDVPYLSVLHGDREHRLIQRVVNLARRCEDALRPSGIEEGFLALGTALLECYEQIRQQAARLPAVRASTRDELFRRLLIGRDYMHANCSEKVSLADTARAACLSVFHFHRAFTNAFEMTPHSYLTGLRLTQARDMIERGSSVLDACVASGFSSPSAFSRLFRARFGQVPSAGRGRFARSGQTENSFSGTITA